MSESGTPRPKFISGLLLILLGIFFLCAQFGCVRWDNLWPFILIIGGILFYWGFTKDKKNFGLLMPGSILTVTGLLFLYTNSGHWHAMESLWPTFILAPAIGFILMYLFAPKGNGLWIPAIILTILALVFFAEFWRAFRYWPVILIIIGLYLLINAGKKSNSSSSKSSDTTDFTNS